MRYATIAGLESIKERGRVLDGSVPIFLDDLLEDVLHAQHQVVDAAPVLRPVELEPGPLLLDDAPVVREAVDLRRAREHAPLALAPALFDGPVDVGRVGRELDAVLLLHGAAGPGRHVRVRAVGLAARAAPDVEVVVFHELLRVLVVVLRPAPWSRSCCRASGP